jgi:hypothetical protein
MIMTMIHASHSSTALLCSVMLSTSSNGQCSLCPEITTTRTNGENIFPVLRFPALRTHIPNSQVSPLQLESDRLALARLDSSLVKTTQLSHRLIRHTGKFDVELRGLSTSYISCVRDAAGNGLSDVSQISRSPWLGHWLHKLQREQWC